MLERERILQTATNEAESTVKQAQARAAVILDQQEILKEARVKADSLIANATEDSQKMRRAATEYVDNLLKKAEETMEQTLSATKQARKIMVLDQQKPQAPTTPQTK